MAVVLILSLALFDIVICVIEIPKMLKQALTRELITFSTLLLFGTVIAVMKILEMGVPNPSELILRAYSPISGWMKSLAKP